MKKLFILLSFIALNASAQDVIVKKDGSTILSKVLEISSSEIKYKKFKNLEGPLYVLNINEVLSINYENGDKDDFSKNTIIESKEENSEPVLEKKIDEKRNRELLSIFNKIYQPSADIKRKASDAKDAVIIWGLKSNSVLSSPELEMFFTRSVRKNPNWGGFWQIIYYVTLKNKTNNIIYIDKGNCFSVNDDGDYRCYYDPTEQIIQTTGNSNGVSIGLGSIAGVFGIGGVVGQLANGISVGKSNGQSTSKAYSEKRFIAIPPQGSAYLSDYNWIKTKSGSIFGSFAEYKTLEDCESYNFFSPYISKIFKRGDFEIGEYKIFDEDEIPINLKYIITYSTNENFSKFSTLNAELFIHEIIGCNVSMDFDNYGTHPQKYIADLEDYTVYGQHDLDKAK